MYSEALSTHTRCVSKSLTLARRSTRQVSSRHVRQQWFNKQTSYDSIPYILNWRRSSRVLLLLQSYSPAVLLLRDQRASAEQFKVRFLGGIHCKSPLLLRHSGGILRRQMLWVVKMELLLLIRWISVINRPDQWSVQVPLELESPTQISIVDEATGEV